MARPKSELVKEFTKGIFNLLEFLSQKRPRDTNIKQLNDRVKVARRIYEEGLVKIAGDYFYKYRQKIFDRDEKFFIENDIIKLEKVDDQLAIDVMNAIREEYFKSTTNERDDVYLIVQGLLITYMEYLMMN
jgi:hypothetical protein